MTLQRWARIALGYLIIVSGQVGAWALFAPKSFYDDFPGLGRAWVSIDGPYNEHLVRDVGALNLAILVLFVAAWIRLDRQLIGLAGVVSLVWGVPHAIYHLLNTDGFEGSDLVFNLLGLLLFVVVGGGLLWVARQLGPDGRIGEHHETDSADTAGARA